MKAAIVSVGDEILRGEVVDTNGPALARLLERRGVEVAAHLVVGDSRQELSDRLAEGIGRFGITCVSGGLGPTRDDITRWAVADAVGRKLEADAATVERIRIRYEKGGRSAPKESGRQALFPQGSEILDNPVGTAPGFICRSRGSVIVALPGVPTELEAMATDAIETALSGTEVGGKVAARDLCVVGMAESDVDRKLGPLMERGRNPLVGLCATDGEIRIHLHARVEGEADVTALLDEAEGKIREALGDAVREPGGVRAVLHLLEAKGWRLAAAESCTGGLVADRITDLPGASRVFAGGVVVYSAPMKVELLGVRRETLARRGEVSEEVAREMAEGVCARTGAQVGIGVTGWAGPTGGPDQPVGLVCVGIRHPGALISRKWLFEGSRRRVKERAAIAAIRFLLDILTSSGDEPGAGGGIDVDGSHPLA